MCMISFKYFFNLGSEIKRKGGKKIIKIKKVIKRDHTH